MAPHLQSVFDGEYDVPLRTPPALVLDIGANCGAFSAYARKEWPDARIIAYEPQPDMCAMMEENCAPYGIELIRKAVRIEAGWATLKLGKNNPGEASFFELGEQTENVIPVECEAASVLPCADLVKIDTEGSELEILKGLDTSNTKAIVLEYHRAEDRDKIKDLLNSRGFLVNSERERTPDRGILKFVRLPNVTPKVFVALPVYGWVPMQFANCLEALFRNPPCEMMRRSICGDSLVSRARNTLTAEFLRSDCTHLLFIDSDLIFSPDQVARLLSHDKEVAAGFYPKKQDGALRWVCNANLDETEADENGLQEVRYMGTGFLMVKREVFTKMLSEFRREMEYNPDHAPHRTEWDFWAVGPYKFDNGLTRYLSEDWYFCQRWLDMGGKVFADTRIICRHIGHAVYPLQSQLKQISNPDE